MQGKPSLLFVLVFWVTLPVFAQPGNNDSLRQLLVSGQVKKMSFDQLYKIQSDNQKLAEELATN
jgi:hypothetical protein